MTDLQRALIAKERGDTPHEVVDAYLPETRTALRDDRRRSDDAAVLRHVPHRREERFCTGCLGYPRSDS